jgi:hypothetical protein
MEELSLLNAADFICDEPSFLQKGPLPNLSKYFV